MKRSFVLSAGMTALALVLPATATNAVAGAGGPRTSVFTYDDFDDADGYSVLDYAANWDNRYGLGEMTPGVGGTRQFVDGTFRADATPFRTAADVSVFDHIKYLAISKQSFAVPADGSITFSMDIAAETPGTKEGYVVDGVYTLNPLKKYQAVARQGQQAGATLHMIDFDTGQLFDWFVSGNTAFTLTERLPATVIGSLNGGTRDTMYTQIVDEIPIKPGVPHNVAITYTRDAQGSSARWYLDGRLVSKVDKVGVPLDVQGVRYTGTYPSLGPGEILKDKVNSVSIGHGLFSLLDAFPFQHPAAPELHVSIPISERIFGQGARAVFDDVVVTTVER